MSQASKLVRRKAYGVRLKNKTPYSVLRTPFYSLGIETSCDETSCAVLRGKDTILSNIVSSSLFRHKKFGGVVPEIASRHCMEQIQCVFEEALREAKIEPE